MKKRDSSIITLLNQKISKNCYALTVKKLPSKSPQKRKDNRRNYKRKRNSRLNKEKRNQSNLRRRNMKNIINKEIRLSKGLSQELIVLSSMMMKIYVCFVINALKKIMSLFIWLISTKIQHYVEHSMEMKTKHKHSSMFVSIQFI